MAEKRGNLEILLSHAKEREKEYDWLGAAEHRFGVLALLSSEDVRQVAEVQEGIAYDFYRGAFQSDQTRGFREGHEKATKHYEEAVECYSRLTDQNALALSNRCSAMVALSGFWTASESSQRKSLLEKAWSLLKESLKGFDSSHNSLQYGKTYNLLAIVAAFLECYGDELRYRENIVREALTCGERAIRHAQEVTQPDVLAEVYTGMSYFLQAWTDDYVEPAEEEKYSLKTSVHFSKAREIHEEIVLACSTAIHQMHSYPDSVSLDDSLAMAKKAVECVKVTKDNYLVGRALENLARWIYWRLASIENPEERKSLATAALEVLLESQRKYEAIGFMSTCSCGTWGVEPYGSHYWWLCEMGSEVEEKKSLAEQSMAYASNYLDLAKRCGFPDNWAVANYVAGSTLYEMAHAEDDPVAKRESLRRAINHLNVSTNQGRDLHPRNYWYKSLDHGRLALAERELAGLTDDPAEKGALLKRALDHRLQALESWSRAAEGPKGESRIFQTEYAGFLYDHGTWCHSVYIDTNDEEYFARSLEALAHSAKWYKKADTPSRGAEVYWKLAELQDKRNEYLKSAESYSASSDLYRSAAGRIPRLKEFYVDYSCYLQAWGEIERARYHHLKQEPAAAMECYKKAAELHGSTKRWSYLASNYLAWFKVENAEDLSRRDESESAIKAFADASELFRESLEAIQRQLPQIDDLETKQMASKLVKVAGMRIDYCGARRVLEEGRILYRKGEASASSEKYDLASEAFGKVMADLESGNDRRDIQLAIALSKAWGRLARAEAESSPGLYEEASKLFEETKDLSEGEKGKPLVQGHSRFCLALAAGTRFSDTGDPDFHNSASLHLENAAKYYLKAGAQAACDHAKASRLLFDAYAHMNEASKEKDHEKKARLYTMAEKVLQTSANYYAKANQPGKEKQVMMLLEKVREERELAVSLTEVLRAPDIVSATTAFSGPILAQEKAAGLDRFEHADVQATLIAKPKELHVGQELSLDIELVNAGRGTAQLTKVEESVPKGFIVVQEPEKYRMEESQINLKGRRLDALKTEDVKLVLKPTAKGNFKLKPRILYLDDSGTYRSCEPTPIEIAVKEMGISGWIRGT